LSLDKTKNRPTRKVEKWSDIVAKLNLDVSKAVNYVDASQIKQITNEEPRLLAKMDRKEDLPRIFTDNNLFLLPISRRKYAIVKGLGYHTIEWMSEKPAMHPLPLPVLLAPSFSEFRPASRWFILLSIQARLIRIYCLGLNIQILAI